MKKCNSKKCHWGNSLAWALLFIGGINWGLTGIGVLADNEKWNLVQLIFGRVGQGVAWLEAIIYLLVGLSALALLCSCCKKCKKDGACAPCDSESKVCTPGGDCGHEGSCDASKDMDAPSEDTSEM